MYLFYWSNWPISIVPPTPILLFFFFFNDTATTEIYTLSLHDALPICASSPCTAWGRACRPPAPWRRSEEHTSELQSRGHLVCRLLLEKKNTATEISPLANLTASIRKDRISSKSW